MSPCRRGRRCRSVPRSRSTRGGPRRPPLRAAGGGRREVGGGRRCRSMVTAAVFSQLHNPLAGLATEASSSAPSALPGGPAASVGVHIPNACAAIGPRSFPRNTRASNRVALSAGAARGAASALVLVLVLHEYTVYSHSIVMVHGASRCRPRPRAPPPVPRPPSRAPSIRQPPSILQPPSNPRLSSISLLYPPSPSSILHLPRLSSISVLRR